MNLISATINPIFRLYERFIEQLTTVVNEHRRMMPEDDGSRQVTGDQAQESNRENLIDGFRSPEGAKSRSDLLLLQQVDTFARQLQAAGEVSDVLNNFGSAIQHPEIYMPWVEIEIAHGLESVKISVRQESLGDTARFAVQIIGGYPQRFWFREDTLEGTVQFAYQQLSFQIEILRSRANR